MAISTAICAVMYAVTVTSTLHCLLSPLYLKVYVAEQIRTQIFVRSKWAMMLLVPHQTVAVFVMAGRKKGLYKPQACPS